MRHYRKQATTERHLVVDFVIYCSHHDPMQMHNITQLRC